MIITRETIVQKHEEFSNAVHEASFLSDDARRVIFCIAASDPNFVIGKVDHLFSVYSDAEFSKVEEPLNASDSLIVVETMRRLVKARRDSYRIMQAWIGLRDWGFDTKLVKAV
ncbi:hypothetical protein EON76_04155 [bacterium]|nr:MAG: hypothetical protein EON76_04155 [bacterium]